MRGSTRGEGSRIHHRLLLSPLAASSLVAGRVPPTVTARSRGFSCVDAVCAGGCRVLCRGNLRCFVGCGRGAHLRHERHELRALHGLGALPGPQSGVHGASMLGHHVRSTAVSGCLRATGWREHRSCWHRCERRLFVDVWRAGWAVDSACFRPYLVRCTIWACEFVCWPGCRSSVRVARTGLARGCRRACSVRRGSDFVGRDRASVDGRDGPVVRRVEAANR